MPPSNIELAVAFAFILTCVHVVLLAAPLALLSARLPAVPAALISGGVGVLLFWGLFALGPERGGAALAWVRVILAPALPVFGYFLPQQASPAGLVVSYLAGTAFQIAQYALVAYVFAKGPRLQDTLWLLGYAGFACIAVPNLWLTIMLLHK